MSRPQMRTRCTDRLVVHCNWHGLHCRLRVSGKLQVSHPELDSEPEEQNVSHRLQSDSPHTVSLMFLFTAFLASTSASTGACAADECPSLLQLRDQAIRAVRTLSVFHRDCGPVAFSMRYCAPSHDTFWYCYMLS